MKFIMSLYFVFERKNTLKCIKFYSAFKICSNKFIITSQIIVHGHLTEKLIKCPWSFN